MFGTVTEEGEHVRHGYLPTLPPERLARVPVEANLQLASVETARRGYLALELTPERASRDYRFIGNVRDKTSGVTANAATDPVGWAAQACRRLIGAAFQLIFAPMPMLDPTRTTTTPACRGRVHAD